MKAIVITRTGGPEVLEVREVPTPEPRGDQVRVRVRACGLNRADLMQCRGYYPAPQGRPADIPGLEYAGEVDALGPDVVGPLEVGDRVFGIVAGGGQAEYVVTHERMAVPIPANLDFEQAAAVPEVFLTAHDALEARAGLRPGESVLIHAVGSGVGTAAVQLARAMGCTVFGTSRTAEKLAARGRARPRRRHRRPRPRTSPRSSCERTGGRGVDVVIDLIGAPALAGNLEALATGGRLVLVGLLGGGTGTVDLSAAAAQAAQGRRHDPAGPAARGEDRGDPGVRRPGRPLAGARASPSGRRPRLRLRGGPGGAGAAGSQPRLRQGRPAGLSRPASFALSWPSWISSTRSSGVMNRRSCVTTTRVVLRLALEPPEDPVDLVAGLRVELAGRLVAEDEDRVLDQGPGDRHPLLLAPRHLVRPVVEPVAQADLASAASRPSPSSRSGTPRGRNGISTFSTAVRLLIRLNDWKMNPTLSRR